MDVSFRQVTLFELEILGELAQHTSLRQLSRAKHLEPPHLSKILSRTEKKLGLALLKRSPGGYLLTPDGQRVVRFAREMLRTSEALLAPQSTEPVTVAAPRFVAAHVVAPALEAVRDGDRRFRLLDMAPDQVATAAASSAAEIVVALGDVDFPRTWAPRPLGKLSWGLYVGKDHPLRAKSKIDDVATFPFIVPTYWNGKGFEAGDDYCPLPWSRRRRGDETSSILTALEIVSRSSEQVVFAPSLVMRRLCAEGITRAVDVEGWRNVVRPVTLWLREDRVRARFADQLEKAMRAVLAPTSDSKN